MPLISPSLFFFQFDPIEIIKGAKDMKPSFSDPKLVDGKMLGDLKGELADLYGLKKNLTVVEKLAKKVSEQEESVRAGGKRRAETPLAQNHFSLKYLSLSLPFHRSSSMAPRRKSTDSAT